MTILMGLHMRHMNRKVFKGHMRSYINMKNTKPKQRQVTRTIWYLKCPKCKKEITGNYEAQANLNLNNHLQKHKKEEKKK